MSIAVYNPTKKNPYVFGNKPICLRTACSAGINRSATVREYIKKQLHPDSYCYPQFGAVFGDQDHSKITGYIFHKLDGFYHLFGTPKCQNLQSIIMAKLGYKVQLDDGTVDDSAEELDFCIRQRLDMGNSMHLNQYCYYLENFFWKTKTDQKEIDFGVEGNKDLSNKNVFVIINENVETINKVYLRLAASYEDVDLVVIREDDTIYNSHPDVEPQSLLAYETFVSRIRHYFSFEK